MEAPEKKDGYVFLLKLTAILLCIALLTLFITAARPVLLPVAFAVLFGIVLRPVDRFLEHKCRFPRVIAILVTVIVFMLLIVTIIFLVTHELTLFIDDLPTLKKNLGMHLGNARHWIMTEIGINYEAQKKYLDGAAVQLMPEHSVIVEKTMSSISGIFSAAIVLPVLLFLVLYYRVLFLDFLLKLAGEKNRSTMTAIIHDTKTALQKYVAGLFLEMISVTILQTLAMTIAGVQYVLLIGLITGVLNMIPYIGTLIAGILGLLISLATGASTSQLLYVLLGFAAVQFIDNNILLPNLVGSRVRINAFFSIVGIIAAGLVSGVGGMFLAIPFMALLKVIFDNIDSLKPWGELMGDKLPRSRWERLRWEKQKRK